MKKPNLFACATKELSQDGFFAWLLQWAAPEHAAANAQLCKCAQEFVKNLITTQHALPPNYEIKSVSAGRQWQNIDVYARVNDDFFIIIEDKTHTKTHDNQLARYRQSAQAMCEHEKRQLVCIYLKTGDESQASFEAIKHDGFAVVVRHDLLAFFKKHDVKNAIYEDFVENLQRIEDAVQSYMTAPIKDWNYFLPLHWYVWTGFFRFLETNFNGKNAAWHVAHPRDSFLYYYWGGKPINDGSCWIYLQIESNTGKLCFKIGTNDALFHEMLTQWHNIIKQHAQSAGMATIQRPERIDASGKTATIAIVNREDWLGADDAIFDANAVLERLEQYTKFLHQCLDDVK